MPNDRRNEGYADEDHECPTRDAEVNVQRCCSLFSSCVSSFCLPPSDVFVSLFSKGKLDDAQKISDTKLKAKSKIMLIGMLVYDLPKKSKLTEHVVGNPLSDILAANKPPEKGEIAAVKDDMEETEAEKEPLCKTAPHSKCTVHVYS